MPTEERRKDQPLMQKEWNLWLEQHFNPWIQEETIAHERLNRIMLAYFGDGNGDAGMQNDIKLLICMSRKVEHFFDGLAWLWKVVAIIIIPLAALAALGKSVEWW